MPGSCQGRRRSPSPRSSAPKLPPTPTCRISSPSSTRSPMPSGRLFVRWPGPGATRNPHDGRDAFPDRLSANRSRNRLSQIHVLTKHVADPSPCEVAWRPCVDRNVRCCRISRGLGYEPRPGVAGAHADLTHRHPRHGRGATAPLPVASWWRSTAGGCVNGRDRLCRGVAIGRRLIDPAYGAVAQRCCEPPPHAASLRRCRSLRPPPTRSCAGEVCPA